MSPPRWNDDRHDDMARTLEKLGTEHRATANLVAAHDLQLVEIERARRAATDRRFEIRLALALVLLGQLGTIITIVVKV